MNIERENLEAELSYNVLSVLYLNVPASQQETHGRPSIYRGGKILISHVLFLGY